MEILEIFQVLGIEATKDEQAIRNAYRDKLSVTNPEDNPEGFKRLRTAYEEACLYAKQTDENTEKEKDTTPSGLWAAQVEDIYKNIHFRQDIERWKALFEEDIFLSLEEEENCRMKLLAFLMDHFKLPTAVWKLLNEKLNLVSDAGVLREHFPVDFIHYVVAKCERGEDVEFGQFEGEPEAAYDMFLQYYDRCWNALQDKQIEQAEEYIKNADELHIYHPVMEVCRAHAAVERGKIEEAIDGMVKLKERFPKDAMVCYNAAEIMWHHDRKEQAAEIYRELKEVNDVHYMANVRLTEWNYEQGQYEEAKKCAETVLAAGADDEFMELLAKVNVEIEKNYERHYKQENDVRSALELGWCYLQDGKVSRGISLVEDLEGRITEEDDAEYQGLLTKLYVEETEYEKALAKAEKWEKALQKKLQTDEPEEEKEKDRNRIRQYHLIRMQCFHALGDMRNEPESEHSRENYEKAIEEGNGILDGSPNDIGLMLEQAQIYMEMEEYEKSLDVCARLVEEHQVYAAYATELEVHRRQWNASGVVQAGQQCIHFFPNYERAYEHVAKVFLDLERPEDLANVLKDAKEQGIESVILDAYQYQMGKTVPDTEVLDEKLAQFRKEYYAKVESGDVEAYQQGLPILTEYLYWYPGTYMLVERGLFHRAAHRYEEAKADFEKALAENPRQPYALNGLSFVYKFEGNYEQALICLKRANRYRDPEMSDVIYADMANLYSLLGNYKEAAKAYEKFAKKTGFRYQYHMSKYAICLMRCGEVDKAVQILKSAYGENGVDYFNEASDLYQIAGMPEKAKELLDKWDSKKKTMDNSDKGDYYAQMAWQELLFGNGDKAVDYMGKMLDCMGEGGAYTDHLSDAVFTCILCGNDKKGREYSAKIRLHEAKMKQKGGGPREYSDIAKSNVYISIMSAYYTKSTEELMQMLDKGDCEETCHHCTYCICKELEAVRILVMLRCGREKEAFARLDANLEKQKDNFMLAIRHICENGIKVTPDAALREEKRTEDTAQSNGANGFISQLKGIFGRKK